MSTLSFFYNNLFFFPNITFERASNAENLPKGDFKKIENISRQTLKQLLSDAVLDALSNVICEKKNDSL